MKGLGVKLLDVVLDIMDEEDEDKRKVRVLNVFRFNACLHNKTHIVIAFQNVWSESHPLFNHPIYYLHLTYKW